MREAQKRHIRERYPRWGWGAVFGLCVRVTYLYDELSSLLPKRSLLRRWIMSQSPLPSPMCAAGDVRAPPPARPILHRMTKKPNGGKDTRAYVARPHASTTSLIERKEGGVGIRGLRDAYHDVSLPPAVSGVPSSRKHRRYPQYPPVSQCRGGRYETPRPSSLPLHGDGCTAR